MDGTTALVELGLAPSATASQISRAFRELAKRTHPDLRGSGAAFRRLREARDVALAAAPVETIQAVDTNVPAPAPSPWLTDLGMPATRFDRTDSRGRPVTAPPAIHSRTDQPDGQGLHFADHLALALAG
ncbi:MAG: J domain-containing protein [Actinomycetia bacterium]|nr:J domain-containing protein [Actinomycetes bacterium]